MPTIRVNWVIDAPVSSPRFVSNFLIFPVDRYCPIFSAIFFPIPSYFKDQRKHWFFSWLTEFLLILWYHLMFQYDDRLLQLNLRLFDRHYICESVARHFSHNRLILDEIQKIQSRQKKKMFKNIPLRKSISSELGLSGTLRLVAIIFRTKLS